MPNLQQSIFGKKFAIFKFLVYLYYNDFNTHNSGFLKIFVFPNPKIMKINIKFNATLLTIIVAVDWSAFFYIIALIFSYRRK